MPDAIAAPAPAASGAPAYAELHCLSDFSFQRGASSAEELFARARLLGYSALAITDECSLAGAVRALKASEETGVRLIVGSEFVLDDGLTVVLLCETRAGYATLSKLITRGRRAAPKGEYRLSREDIVRHVFADGTHLDASATGDASTPHRSDGLFALWIPRRQERWGEELRWLRDRFGDRLRVAVERHREAGETARIQHLVRIAQGFGVPLVACGDVHMHHRSRRALQDAMTAIRLGRPLADCGHALFPNGERHLRPRESLRKLHDEAWMAESVRIAERCRFTMRDLKYRYPAELVPDGHTPTTWLRKLTEDGLRQRWPQGESADVRRLVEKELTLIAELEYEAFFLTVEDIVRWARAHDILCQGRGSAANSIVCYCLRITSVSPDRIGMLFERFLSKERDEPPDIDVDFEHERREEVLQYVYEKYGRERAALAATVIAYRSKSAARDLGMALGFPQDRIEELSQAYRYGFGAPLSEKLRERGFDPDAQEVMRLTALVQQMYGKPRHLSQHVGGFVISGEPLHDLVPVENASMADRSVIQWDKDDLEYLGLLKVDCLALGMLTCLRKCFRIIERHGGPRLRLADVDEGDEPTYEMIRRADTIGVFQIESRAQMAMLPRLRPEHYYHLVIQIAIVRPGPIEGGMVNPYLEGRARERAEREARARSGAGGASPSADDPDFMAMGEVENEHHRAVKALLKRTCGVPIFQEQVMALLKAAADFSEGEADQLRRSMAAWKKRGGLEHFEEKIFAGMRRNGFSDEYAQRIYRQILGFGSYGFPESHAASFALLAYVSCWLKCRYPAVFACGLLNSLPMGFYGPAQIVADLRRHGYAVSPPDVTRSEWDHRLERAGVNLCPDDDAALWQALPPQHPRVAAAGSLPPSVTPGKPPPPDLHDGRVEYDRNLGLRLGLRAISGLGEDVAQRIVAARRVAPFRDVADLVRRARVDVRSRDALASAGALHRLAGHRHRAYWDIAGIDMRDDVLRNADFDERRPVLRPPSAAENLTADYATLGLTLGRHPLQLLRPQLQARLCRRSDELQHLQHGAPVRFAGLVTLRQHPEAAKGVTFMTLEDERGLVNIVVWQQVALAQRRPMLESRLLHVAGRLEHKDGVLHVVARTLQNWNAMLGGLRVESRDFH
ncbi:error-prone DNA polymerase [Chiayiivirga flava]|uniref:Error-prone DNA polymerase n=1 Tax=Chiayiivirga flava TaxID=659595 RepID=A0A7W8D2M2_9GAMM|nr:error-prone DNA polymerase [Chiayiivirga flava]MBB5206684.1 error-prone DNA polymerase [Chiayiivirga flava]